MCETCLVFSPYPLVPRGLFGAAYFPIFLGAVEQMQSGNGDRETIVVGAGLCNDEGISVFRSYCFRS